VRSVGDNTFYKALSYSDFIEDGARQTLGEAVKAFSVTSPDVSTHLRPD